MDILGLLALIALGGSYWLLRRREKSTWVQVDYASGKRLESLYRNLVCLRHAGVRCRMKTGFTVWTTHSALQVHREDRERALSILQDGGEETKEPRAATAQTDADGSFPAQEEMPGTESQDSPRRR